MPPPAAPRPAAAQRSMPANVAKAASQKIISPAQPAAAAPASAAAPAAPPVQAAAPAAAQQSAAPAAAAQQPPGIAAAATAPKKDAKPAAPQKLGFKVNEWIVYPAHGVGRIVAIEEQEIAGISLELFVITFEKDKMTLRVPTGKSTSVGMRKLAEEATVKKAIETLKGRARIKRTMWSRRAQEYEAKINSGDLIAIAEVVRDLYRSESQPEQSYSERQLYEAALDRMAREIAVVEKLDERGAVQRITEVLAKSARGRGVAAEAA
jgi:CarD family transcriptional regulator